MQPIKQSLSRVAKVEHNLREQTDWLAENFEKAYFSGFNYAHIISKDITAPIVYNFDNPSRRASNSSTLASLSEIGDFELQLFRLNESPCRNGYPNGKDTSAAIGSHNSLFPAFADGQDGQEHDGSDSSSFRRPVAGSFLGSVDGGCKAGNNAHAESINIYGKNSSIISMNSNYNNGSKSSNYQNGISHADRAEHKTVPIYPASYNSSNINSNSNSNYDSYNYNRSSSGPGDHCSMAPPKSYCDDISDSQLAVFDIDGKCLRSARMQSTGLLRKDRCYSIHVALSVSTRSLHTATAD